MASAQIVRSSSQATAQPAVPPPALNSFAVRFSFSGQEDWRDNPLSDFLTDDLFQVLKINGLISEKGLRDFVIRRIFQHLKKDLGMPTYAALEKLGAAFPYLQSDTIRKIVYNVYPVTNRKPMI